MHCDPQVRLKLWQPDWAHGTIILQQFGWLVFCWQVYGNPGNWDGIGWQVGTPVVVSCGAGIGIGTGIGTGTVFGSLWNSIFLTKFPSLLLIILKVSFAGTILTFTLFILDISIGTSILFSLLTVLFIFINVVTVLFMLLLLLVSKLVLDLVLSAPIVPITLTSGETWEIVVVLQQLLMVLTFSPQHTFEHWLEQTSMSSVQRDWQLLKHADFWHEDLW